MKKVGSYQFSCLLCGFCIFLLSVSVHADALQSSTSKRLVPQDEGGLIIRDGLTVVFSPDSLVHYDGMLPSPVTTISGPYGESVVIRNLPDDAIFFPGESIDGLKDFTIAFYIKLNGLNYHNNIISMANASNDNELIVAYNYVQDDMKGILITVEQTTIPFPNTETALSDLEWHHIIITRSNDIAKVYVDGELTGDSISIGSELLNVDSGGFVIGQDQDEVGGGFQWYQNLHGAIGGLKVFHYVLGAESISALSSKNCPVEGTACNVRKKLNLQTEENLQSFLLAYNS